VILQQTLTARPSVAPHASPRPHSLADMELSALARQVAAESERFYRGQAHDTSFAYELFRRALVERSEAAWALLYQQYCGLVEGWVRRCGAFAQSGESGEYFVGGAFSKFWHAVTPERFERFPSLASLLNYLRLCTTSVVIDSVRAQSWAEMLPEEALDPARAPQSAPDEEALARVQREEFWRLVDAQLHDESERVVVYGSFVLGLTPRALAARHTGLFAGVGEVYNIKRNVLSRLGRNRQIQQLLDA
jgi:hypothetical protein